MKSIAMVIVVIALVGGGIYYALGSSGGGQPLGQGVPAEMTVTSISDLTADPDAYKGKEVAVEGKLAQVCPTTGCWGVLDDGTGTVRFDTAASGWALPPGKGGKHLAVRGTVSINPQGTPEIAATGGRL